MADMNFADHREAHFLKEDDRSFQVVTLAHATLTLASGNLPPYPSVGHDPFGDLSKYIALTLGAEHSDQPRSARDPNGKLAALHR
ncbi:hypothetical protein [Mesorhizobium sp.]|uniref:hypothetical protein n=1 Tax=Mesorhizobium sp. TaxID=1871066 RepID=UPI000FE61D14|nr:hypothetical protein [Mesorhizobium sp.]RWA77145.1 MAG: hypothetical protein EOQ30_33070 [Mesorhizobium sp.]